MDEIDKRFIEIYKEIGRTQGLDELLMTLFARIYIEPGEIAMENLAKETGYSLASISTKINMFAPIFGIKRMRKPGSKKIFLYLEKDFTKIIKESLIRKEQYCINTVKEKVPPLLKEYKSKAKTEKDRQKLNIIEDYYGQIIKFEKIIKGVLKELEAI